MEGQRLADFGYQQGINTQVEVIDAQSALTTARVNYLRAIYQHVVAKLAVDRAMGTIVETPNVETSSAGATEGVGQKTEEGKPGTGDGASRPPAQDAGKKD
jgi:hypothetical protein